MFIPEPLHSKVEASRERVMLERIRSGDKESFSNMFLTYYLPLCRFCTKILHSEHIAEEIVQELFADLWDRHSELIIRGALSSYLHSAAKNRSLNYIKHRNIEHHYLKEIFLAQLPTEEVDQAWNRTFRIAVRKAIRKLPDRSRQVYTLHRREGLTYSEIAMVLNVSQKTVERHMTRALQSLREQLSSFAP